MQRCVLSAVAVPALAALQRCCMPCCGLVAVIAAICRPVCSCLHRVVALTDDPVCSTRVLLVCTVLCICSFQGRPMPVLLDASSVRPDTILLLDTFFQVSALSHCTSLSMQRCIQQLASAPALEHQHTSVCPMLLLQCSTAQRYTGCCTAELLVMLTLAIAVLIVGCTSAGCCVSR